MHDVPQRSERVPIVLIAQAGIDSAQRAPVQPQLPAARTWLIARDAAGYSAELGQALGTALACGRSARRDRHRRAGLMSGSVRSAMRWIRAPRRNGTAARARCTQCGEEPHGLDSPGWPRPRHGLGVARGTRRGARVARRRLHRVAAELRALRHPPGMLGHCRPQAGAGPLLPRHARTGTADGARRRRSTGCAMRRSGASRAWRCKSSPIGASVGSTCTIPCPARPMPQSWRRRCLHPDAEDEIMLTAAGRYAPRLSIAASGLSRRQLVQPQPSRPSCPARLFRAGALSQSPLAAAPDWARSATMKWRSRCAAAGLNFRDVMYAMGLLPDEAVEDGFCGPTLGMEVAGHRDSRGDSASSRSRRAMP